MIKLTKKDGLIIYIAEYFRPLMIEQFKDMSVITFQLGDKVSDMKHVLVTEAAESLYKRFDL